MFDHIHHALLITSQILMVLPYHIYIERDNFLYSFHKTNDNTEDIRITLLLFLKRTTQNERVDICCSDNNVRDFRNRKENSDITNRCDGTETSIGNDRSYFFTIEKLDKKEKSDPKKARQIIHTNPSLFLVLMNTRERYSHSLRNIFISYLFLD